MNLVRWPQVLNFQNGTFSSTYKYACLNIYNENSINRKTIVAYISFSNKQEVPPSKIILFWIFFTFKQFLLNILLGKYPRTCTLCFILHFKWKGFLLTCPFLSCSVMFCSVLFLHFLLCSLPYKLRGLDRIFIF